MSDATVMIPAHAAECLLADGDAPSPRYAQDRGSGQSETDRAYHLDRAATEVRRGLSGTSLKIAHAHFSLATLHYERVSLTSDDASIEAILATARAG